MAQAGLHWALAQYTHVEEEGGVVVRRVVPVRLRDGRGEHGKGRHGTLMATGVLSRVAGWHGSERVSALARSLL